MITSKYLLFTERSFTFCFMPIVSRFPNIIPVIVVDQHLNLSSVRHLDKLNDLAVADHKV